MRYSNKDKDNTLKSCYKGDSSQVDSEMIAILRADEFIVTLTSPNGIAHHITDKGTLFYLNGGYKGAKKMERTKAINNFARSIISATIGSILTILIEHVLLPWLKNQL
jgi:hypothetical protein